MNILIFKHIADEPAGHAEQWAAERGHSFTYHYWDNDHVLTSFPDFDLLIIMGGLMGAYEEDAYPWLIHEKALIREAIAGNRKVFGICLGAQLIASAMGAKVYKHTNAEIGFHLVKTSDDKSEWFSQSDKEFRVFQWHGDTFDLPRGARRIATSENVKNQAFTLGDNVVALQFHPEMNQHIIEGLLDKAYTGEPPSSWKQSPRAIRQFLHCVAPGRQMLFDLLDKITRNKDGIEYEG